MLDVEDEGFSLVNIDDTTDNDLPDFKLMTLNETWGPACIPEEFKDMPYQQFSKDARIGRVCKCNVHMYSCYR